MKKIFSYIFLVIAVAVALGYLQFSRQGVRAEEWTKYFGTTVEFDSNGIPTINGQNWPDIYEKQGFVVASERLWQMDLIRRKTAGELAEWFGSRALSNDIAMAFEDRRGVAHKSLEFISAEERMLCDRFAKGVNRFIANFTGRWGTEYFFLQTEPKFWKCEDSVLVLMAMGDDLTSTADKESYIHAWREQIPAAWGDFLFSRIHPWNTPLIGSAKNPVVEIPAKPDNIPFALISAEESASNSFVDQYVVGSNSWAYKGAAGNFMANDPHLGVTVPAIWYANRLKISKTEWVVGVSVPGIPGVILGMNPELAWSFTNTSEDVDDLVLEEINPEMTKYKDYLEDGTFEWLDIVRKPFLINVKGKSEPVKIMGLFTKRGPLKQYSYLGERWYSRQWLGLRPEVLRAAVLPVNTAKNIEEFLQKLRGVEFPSQNVIVMDRAGNTQLQISGTGIKRKNSSNRIQSAQTGAWDGYKAFDDRPKVAMPESEVNQFMVTANQRVFGDDFEHFWFSDDRTVRIKKLLSESGTLDQNAMAAIQLDTQSEFRRMLISWMVSKSMIKPKNADQWTLWDGNSRSNQSLFMAADIAKEAMVNILLGRIKKTFMKAEDANLPFYGLERLLITKILEDASILEAFGIGEVDLATHLMKVVQKSKSLIEYPIYNASKAQHPFVGAVPVLGLLFKIPQIAQWGGPETVNAERPYFGVSTRLVWNLTDPKNSTWAFPLGQSGHLTSPFYYSFQEKWADNKRTRVFPSPAEFGL